MATTEAQSPATPLLDIRLFGHAGVRAAGVSVKLAKRTTTLAMLALVILRRGASISRTALAFTLYPDADETSALAELRRNLYLFNKALPNKSGEPWLSIDAESVRWNGDEAAFVDIIAFERLAADERTHAAAINLYTGDLLEEVYDDWVVAERERLRSRYLTILGDALARHRERREYDAALDCARRILICDPWREDTLRTLVALRYESGDTAGALAEYDRFARRLRDELEIAPMPETVAVRQSILRNEPIPGSFDGSPAVTDRRSNAPPMAPLPFVGRKPELMLLHTAWSRVARGSGAFVVIRGEAGVGKTRVTAELARRVASEGGRVYVGTTSAPESVPYQAFAEALRSGLPVLLARPPNAGRRAVLARFVPELRDPRLAEIALPEQSPERETARIYDALAAALRSLASPRPLLLVLEDLHWAGPATIEALGAIVNELTRNAVLVLATAREEDTPSDHPLRALQRSQRALQHVDEIALERFAPAEVAQLVTRVEGLRNRDDGLAAELYARSEGNALLLNEAISGVLEGNAAGTPPAASTQKMLAARLDRLGEDARAVAEIAAVIGPGCSVGLVRDATNLPMGAVSRGFDELLDRRIVREAGARARYDYVFTHHLIAAAMYECIEPAFRAQRHARIARLLEKQSAAGDTGTPAREVARHYELAGDAAASAPWYLTAARAAAGVYAYGDAIELATRAHDNAASVDLRRAALDVRERAFGRRGDRAGQRADIEALGRLAGGDPGSEFDILIRRILLARTLGESAAEGELIAKLEAVAASIDDDARAQALAQRATYAGLRSRQAEGLAPARAALAIYERLGDTRGQLDCLFLLVDFTTNTGDLEASRAYLALMRARAATTADRIVEARALAVAAVAALLRQEYVDSLALSKEALAIHVATNDREAEAASRGRIAVIAAWLADFRTSLREFDLALQTYESIGHKRGLAITHTNRTLQLMRLGLFEEALVSIERSNALFATVKEQRTIVANGVNASFVQLHLGDAVAARDLAREALSSAREIGFPIFEAAALANLGNAERALGEYAAAIEHMEAGLAIRRSIQTPPEFVEDLSDLALAYGAAGRSAAALATAEELASIGATSFDSAFWPHYIHWAMAEGFRVGGQAERAAQAAALARRELQAFAACIEDDRARASFLAVPINVYIANGA